MKIFLYEFITGGGLLPFAEWPADGSLLREGAAMIRALAADCAALPDVEVTVLRDTRAAGVSFPGCRVVDVDNANDERSLFRRLAADADWTVVLAPEIDGALLARVNEAVAAGGRLLGPPPELVKLAGHKHACNAHLRAHGVPVPHSRLLEPGQLLPLDWQYPSVIKPVDGAGSQGLRLIAGVSAFSTAQRPLTPALSPEYRGEGARKPEGLTSPTTVASRCVLEHFVDGLPASVALLCGPAGNIALPPCRQHLSDDGSFYYLGGSLPLPDDLASRARRLAERAVATLPAPLGYLGIDLVLGCDPAGRNDCVIEINPRLTTSYVGLRAAAGMNLTRAMLEIAVGRLVNVPFCRPFLSFNSGGEVQEFDPSNFDSGANPT